MADHDMDLEWMTPEEREQVLDNSPVPIPEQLREDLLDELEDEDRGWSSWDDDRG